MKGDEIRSRRRETDPMHKIRQKKTSMKINREPKHTIIRTRREKEQRIKQLKEVN